MVRMRALEGK
jgi:hypothetical protein